MAPERRGTWSRTTYPVDVVDGTRAGGTDSGRVGRTTAGTIGLDEDMSPPTRSAPASGEVAGETLADRGEFAVIAAIRDAVAEVREAAEDVLVGPGDDAAVLRVRTGHVVVSTDLLVEDRHFRRDWSEAYDIGRRAAAQNLADIAAMGGVATALTVGLAAPPTTPVAWVRDLARGLAEEAAEVGADVVGGDLTSADQIVVAVTVLGACAQAPVLRDGARPGDVVALMGRQGWSAAGLAVLSRGFRSPRAVVEAHRRPQPPYAAGPAAAAAGATAMIDVSDGLLADLAHVAAASGVGIDVDPTAFTVPEQLHAVGAALGADPMAFLLTGGEDHALAACFASLADVPPEWRVIGEVREGAGVTVAGEAYDGPAGHVHF